MVDISKMPKTFTLKSAYGGIVPAESSQVFASNLWIVLPWGSQGRIIGTEELTIPPGLTLQEGVLTCQFRGNVRIKLTNISPSTILIKKGQLLARLICEKSSGLNWEKKSSSSKSDSEDETIMSTESENSITDDIWENTLVAY